MTSDDMTSADTTQNETHDAAATTATQQPDSAVTQDDGLADSLRSIRGVGESRTGVDADDA